MTVPTLRWGRTQLEVPAVSLGTWAFGGANKAGDRDVGWSGQSDADALSALEAAYAAGITHWDTADVYGNGHSETLIGRMWARGVKRSDIVLATKVGWDQGGYDQWYHPDMIDAHIDGSLRRLNTDVIDVYYLHHCDFGPEDAWLAPALERIRRAQSAGKIRYIGLSDWSSERIARLMERVDPDVVQPYRNVTDQQWKRSGLADLCAKRDCGVAFFSPLRHGLLLGKYLEPPTFAEGDYRNNDSAFRDTDVLARLVRHRDHLNATFGDRCAQPVLGALVGALTADTPNACVLLGQRNPTQVTAAADSAMLRLSEEEAAAVIALYKDLPV